MRIYRFSYNSQSTRKGEIRTGSNMETWHRGYRAFFMLNSNEHEMHTPQKLYTNVYIYE